MPVPALGVAPARGSVHGIARLMPPHLHRWSEPPMFLSVIEPNPALPASRETMSADAVYQFLAQGCAPDSVDGFEPHLIACIFALAVTESSAGQRSLSATTGLDPADLANVIESFFPHAAYLGSDTPVVRHADEACLRDLLVQCATDGTEFQIRLAAMIARRAQSAN